MSDKLRKIIRAKAIAILLRFSLFMPLRVREIFIIFLSIFSNSLFRTLKICGYFVQQLINSVFIMLIYYLGVGLSAVWSRLIRADYLSLKDRGQESFWCTKDYGVEEKENLKRQF